MTADPLAAAISHLADDPVIGPLIERYGPCTLKSRSDYFLVLCNSIISQQISVKAAESIFRRFCGAFGGIPDPERVAQSRVEELKKAGLSSQKAGYLLDLARKFAAGEVSYHNFPSRSNEQIIKELVNVRGIGRWTAEMFLIFALNRLNVLPVDDLGIRRAFQLQFDLPGLASATEIREGAKSWCPYETVACWYLWRSLENVPVRSEV